jgi:hypothetical protein
VRYTICWVAYPSFLWLDGIVWSHVPSGFGSQQLYTIVVLFFLKQIKRLVHSQELLRAPQNRVVRAA